MPTQFKGTSIIILALSVLFILFFQYCKQSPILADINPFADDPYDAVGSFGVLLALFAAAISTVRAFRYYSGGLNLNKQVVFLLRGEFVTILAVAITLVADAVAMLSHPDMWMGSPSGNLLLALLVAMALFSGLTGFLLLIISRKTNQPASWILWLRAIIITLIAIVLLFLYPESLRESIVGEMFTAIFGITFLFIPLWSLATSFIPDKVGADYEDMLDDLLSVYRSLKSRTRFLRHFYTFIEKVAKLRFVQMIVGWLNPRRHRWNIAVLLGILMGLVLAVGGLSEDAESIPFGQFALVASVFIILGSIGLLTGFILLADLLGLFRRGRE